MSRHKSFIQLLRKTGLIFLLLLTIIMLLHILITLYLCTSVPPWNEECTSIFDSILMVILYYVIPIITLLCFYLFMCQLAKLETLYLSRKHRHKKRSATPSHSHPSKSLEYESYTPRHLSKR